MTPAVDEEEAGEGGGVEVLVDLLRRLEGLVERLDLIAACCCGFPGCQAKVVRMRGPNLRVQVLVHAELEEIAAAMALGGCVLVQAEEVMA